MPRFHCPERTARLTQVLDYFHGMKSAVSQDHMVFRWERSPDFGDGDAILIRQVCLQMGSPWTTPSCLFICPGRAGAGR